MRSLDMLFKEAANRKEACISVAVAQDPHVLEAVSSAYKMGIAKAILVGDEKEIKRIAKEENIDISQFAIINETDKRKACEIATRQVAEGKATALMKGLIDTSVVMKAVLNKEAGMRTGRKLSHLAAFEVPVYHKLLFVTDAALNISPDLSDKKDIIQNAINAVSNLGIKNPKVALLAAKEKVDEKMPVTIDWENIVEMTKNKEILGGIVDGPLALDNAVSKEACEIKGIAGAVGGDADILVCPNIESGNILYKTLAFLAQAKSGGVVVGAKRPIILTSRADSSESKLISIVLGVLF